MKQSHPLIKQEYKSVTERNRIYDMIKDTDVNDNYTHSIYNCITKLKLGAPKNTMAERGRHT